jgi:phage repressor protein C with HTH and peptisase S24 domain
MDKEDNRIREEISKRVAVYLSESGKTPTELQAITGINQSNLTKIINGKRVAAEGVVNKLALTMGADKQYLMTGVKSESDKKEEYRPRIPMSASAGVLNIALSGVTIEDCELIPVVKAFSKYDYTILVRGDSMEPEFHSGDEVACLAINERDFVQWGKYHVLDTKQGILIKRIFDNGDFITCRSEESELFPDFDIHKSEVYGIGLAVGMLRRF